MKRRTRRAFLQILLTATLPAVFVAQDVAAGGNGESSTISTSAATPDPATTAARPGVAVVELFTSEGCSSCPPADKVLSTIVAEARRSGAPAYALAWHVDYWDYLGWKDPYDSKTFTERQRIYARAFSSQLYTPEIVVNGTKVAAYAGDAGEVGRIVSRSLARPAEAGVRLTIRTESSARKIQVGVAVSGGPRRGVVALALVEDGLVQTPAAGENAGRTLHHMSVVRAFATLPIEGGATDIAVPAGAALARSHLMAFVQDSTTLAIVGANSADLSSLDSASGDGSLPAPDTRVSGSLVGRNGRGIEGALVQACSEALCIPAKSDETGRYTLGDIPAGHYTIKLYVPGETEKPLASHTVTVHSGDQIFLPTVAVGT